MMDLKRGLTWLSAALLASLIGFTSQAGAQPKEGPWVYVGTYTGPKSKGIYVMKMDAASGALSDPQVAAEIKSPSFLAIHPSQKLLYAVSEIGGKTGGIVSAFSIAPETGQLTLINQQGSGGS